MQFTYRAAVQDDAAALLDFLKTVGGETGNLTFGAEGLPFSVEQERKYLEGLQDDPSSCLFLALDGDRIVGDSGLSGSRIPRLCHRRELGISVLRDYWGRGVGTEGLRLTLEKGRDVIPEEEFYLRLYKYNTPSLRVMQKNGGRIVGEDEEHFFVRIPK